MMMCVCGGVALALWDFKFAQRQAAIRVVESSCRRQLGQAISGDQRASPAADTCMVPNTPSSYNSNIVPVPDPKQTPTRKLRHNHNRPSVLLQYPHQTQGPSTPSAPQYEYHNTIETTASPFDPPPMATTPATAPMIGQRPVNLTHPTPPVSRQRTGPRAAKAQLDLSIPREPIRRPLMPNTDEAWQGRAWPDMLLAEARIPA